MHCPVMNFLKNNQDKGIQDDSIIQRTIDFFECDVIAHTRNDFWAKIAPIDNCPRCIRAKASTNNINDILDLIKKLDPEDVSTPIYVIKCLLWVTLGFA